MDILTPLQKLDNAIEEFFRDTDQLTDGGFITGWVIGASKTRIQSDDETALPMVSGSTYAFGPQTTVTNGMGLAKYLEIVFEKATWQQMSEEADED